jgi:hypothetical protein
MVTIRQKDHPLLKPIWDYIDSMRLNHDWISVYAQTNLNGELLHYNVQIYNDQLGSISFGNSVQTISEVKDIIKEVNFEFVKNEETFQKLTDILNDDAPNILI